MNACRSFIIFFNQTRESGTDQTPGIDLRYKKGLSCTAITRLSWTHG